MRTTLDIDGPLLRELKQLQEREGKTLGRLVSDLLADALGRRRTKPIKTAAFAWKTRAMRAKVDITDKDALYVALDGVDAVGSKRGRHS